MASKESARSFVKNKEEEKKKPKAKKPSSFKAITMASVRRCVQLFKFPSKQEVKQEGKVNDKKKYIIVSKSMQISKDVGPFMDQFVDKNFFRLFGHDFSKGSKLYFEKDCHVVVNKTFVNRRLEIGNWAKNDRMCIADMIMNCLTEAINHACVTALAQRPIRGTVKLCDIQDALIMITNVLHGPDRRPEQERGYSYGRFWIDREDDDKEDEMDVDEEGEDEEESEEEEEDDEKEENEVW